MSTNLTKESALKCKQPGEITKNILGIITGSESDVISKQNNETVKNIVNSDDGIENDLLNSMYQFIKESCEKYKQITNDFISL